MPNNTIENNIIQSPPAEKKAYIAGMFNQIASKYDFLNRFLSLGIDQYWRRKTIKIIKSHSHCNILDVATGTGDLAIKLSKLNPKTLVGIDISKNMLAIALNKFDKRNIKINFSFIESSCEQMPFHDNLFDCVSIAFGIRNFADINKSLHEIYRVLSSGGQLVILEFSKPRNKLIKFLYFFYFSQILPFIGKIFSKNNYAYRYLPASVNVFPEREEFCKILRSHGFTNVKYNTYTFGIVSIYQCFADK